MMSEGSEENSEEEEWPGYPNLVSVELKEQRRAWLLTWLWELGKGGAAAKTVIKEAEDYERFLVSGNASAPILKVVD